MNIMNAIKYKMLLPLLLLIPWATSTIISNLPTIVTQNKNYTTDPPVWLTSPYMRANNQYVISSLTGSSQFPFASYTFTYSSPLPGVPNLAYGIQRYRGNDYLGQEYWEIRQTARTATTFSVEIQIFGVTNLWILSVAYLAVDPTFPHHLNSFDNVPINYTAGNIVNISTKSSTQQYYLNQINYTSQAAGSAFTQFTTPYSSNYVVIFMTSLWIAGNFGTPIKFHVNTEIINSSHYSWNISLWHGVMVTNVHFSQIIFNSDDVQSSGTYFIVFSRWFNNMDGGFLEIPIEFVDNFIMGVTAFEVTDAACGFQYQWQFKNKTVDGVPTFGVEMLRSWTKNNRCGFDWSESYIFYMMTWQCTGSHPFFNLTTGGCQDACGKNTFENTINNTCDPCPNPKCYQCEDNITEVCTYCASYLFYELSPNNECVCFPSYFETNSSCLPCEWANEGCLNCTYEDGNNGNLPYNSSLFVCVQCNTTFDYFLNSTLCQKCTLQFCLDCQNLTACGLCNSSYDYSDAQTCIDCLVTGCYNCSASDQNNCTTCDQSIGYYNNITTWQCSALCADGIWVSAQQGCDDNNTIDFDGCSSSCVVEPGFICEGSPSYCYFTPNATLAVFSQEMENQSVVCNTITFGLQISPASQTFAQSYITWDNFISSPNDSILVVNSSMFNYSSGIFSISYWILQDLQNQTLIFQSNFSSLLQNSTIFTNTTAPDLAFTVSTSDPQALMMCCRGFYMNLSDFTCVEICGDGILFQLPCDDGNIADGDGCDMNCTVEQHYTCINGTPFTPSICSYNGPIELSLVTAYKYPTNNSLNLTYWIGPVDPLLLITNGSTDFTSLVSYPNFDLNVTSATLDPDTSLLVIYLDYYQHLQDRDLVLQITPPALPQTFATPNYTHSWSVQTTNQLAVMAYSPQNYQELKMVALLVNIIIFVYLSVFFLSIFFRKFVGLELAALIQLGYLSLLMNKEITFYLQPLADASYIFGYNYFHLHPLPSSRMHSPYHLYGYQPHFGFTNNLMTILTAAFFAVAIVLLVVSLLISRGASKRLKKAAYYIATDIGYALVVFSTPNVVTSLCLQIKEGTLSDSTFIWSKLFLIGSCVMLLIAHFLNLATAEQNLDVGIYLRSKSKFGVYFPIIFSTRVVLMTLLLFFYHFSPTIPLYLILILQLGFFFFVMLGRPHKRGFDIFRSVVVELALLYVVGMRYAQINYLANYVGPQNSLFATIAYLQYAAYILAILLSVISLVYHIVRLLRGRVEQPEAKSINESIADPVVLNQSMRKLSSRQTKKIDSEVVFFDIEEDIPNTSASSGFSPLKRNRKRRTRPQK